MRGRGVAHGGVSVLNAIPTGVGGAVGVDLRVEARVELLDERVFLFESSSPRGPVDPPVELGEALLGLAGRYGFEGGLRVEVSSMVPPAAGLKSSSALVNAVVMALGDALGLGWTAMDVARLGVWVARRAGLTVTGAFDDSLASVSRGVFITDNVGGRVLRRYRTGGLYAVIRVPGGMRSIYDLDVEGFRALRGLYWKAVDRALRGDWLGAATVNGFLTLRATGCDGESLELISSALMVPGVVAAGVSGKGPSVFALTGDPGAVVDVWGGDVLVAGVLG